MFPIYLVPSLPFRRRQSSTDSNATSATSTSSSSPPTTDSFLTGHASHLRCARCAADLALSSQIISKGFTGRHGRAYLVAPSASAISAAPPLNLHTAKAKNAALPNLPNTYTHKPVPRQLVTGAHTVGDISCAQCGSVLGWKYVAAEEEAQRYKVGKFILETKRVCRSSTWENEDDGGGGGGMADVAAEGLQRRRDSVDYRQQRRRRSLYGVHPPDEVSRPFPEDDVEFDSQDEDECEDLFLGVWTPQLAAKRRKAKMFARCEEEGDGS
ncbi:hypothetical protein KC340_g14560 [Hortaea werneckii]|nr:hypothetical protein KC339_g10294 [Hortaea werneckii]KAI7220792.1 hypothetical protein KC365_g11895 [Hortaea werneckii]KAI7298051.1 hypothetical protein KC340_g14560 [Hortaea werneckii]KAI7394090.1 hypothetical protein KC328_g6304 [Hortaea werneckii]